MRLLDARRVQVLQDHGREVLLPVVAGLGLGEVVDEFVILVDAERAVRGQALDRERAGDADDAPILVGLVVQVLEVRLGGDGGVDLLSAARCAPPTSGGAGRSGTASHGSHGWPGTSVKGVVAAQSVVQSQQCVGFLRIGLGRLQPFPRCRCRLGPRLASLSRDLPLLPTHGQARRSVPPASGSQRLLPPLPDHVDLGVVDDRFQGDVRYPLVHEAPAGCRHQLGASDCTVCVSSASFSRPAVLSASR